MRGKKSKFLPIVFCLAALASLQAEGGAVKELGAPYIRNYTSDDHGGNEQNWAAAQDQRGITYFGNGNGVLEFDGRNWALIRLPNDSYVRSLDIDSQGKVYIGSAGEFGFLAVDAQGKTVYVSLLPKLKKEDQNINDVVKTFATSHGVFFLTPKKVFLLLNDRIEVIPVDLIRGFGFKISDEVFIVQKNQGIFLIRNTQPQFLPYTEKFTTAAASPIIRLLPCGEQQLFIIDGEGQFSIYDLKVFYEAQKQTYDFNRPIDPTEIIKPFPTEVSAYIGKSSNNLLNLISLPGGRSAFATQKGGIVIMDSQGKLERVINKNRGLLDNNVNNLGLDREQNLWAALNTGIAYVAISSPVSRFDAATGLEGYLDAVTRFKDRIFVGSFTGVSVLDDYQLKLKDDNHHFSSLHPEVRNGWGFLPFGDYLLTASSPKALLVDSQLRLQAFGNDTYYVVERSPKFPDTVFAGTSDGLGVFFVQSDAAGRSILTFRKDIFKEVTDPIRRIVPDGNGNLWLSTFFKGLIHIRFRSQNLHDCEITRYGISEGLPKLDWDYVYFIDGRLLVTTQKGVYEGIPATPDPPRTPPTHFRAETTFGKFFSDPPTAMFWIAKDSQGRWLAQSKSGTVLVDTDREGRFRLRREWFTPIPPTEEVPHLDERGILWVPTSKGLYRFDPALSKDYEISFPAMIRRVTAGKDQVIFAGNHYNPGSKQGDYFTRLLPDQPDSMIPTLAYAQNAIRFNFAAPFYEYDAAIRFRYILEGFEKSWSGWTEQNTKEYTNLAEGSYAFRVKARNIYGHESSEAVFRFFISPPWYRTLAAYLGFTIIGLGLLAGGARAYTFKLHREKERLERIVTERTEEIARKNQELKEASLTDPLTGLRNRRYITEILANDVSAFVGFKKYVLEAKDRRNLTEQQRAVFGVVMFDLDHFKMVNDTYGHDAGDKVLQQFAGILKESVRADDAVMRTGGEEFLVVLKKTMPEYLENFIRKVMVKIQQHDFQVAEKVVLKRTCSMGYAAFPFYEQHPDLLSFEQTIMVADLGLYYAKEHGRNLAVRIDSTLNVPGSAEDARKMVTSLDFALKENYLTLRT